jgi:uroporphyrinogen-III decarboxylase
VTDRERFVACIPGEPVDRPPYCLFWAADLDHLVPSDVSWENFCYYARALARLVGKET